jgi:type I restriction enzyme, R subunit
MAIHNEDTRVKIPAILHLTRLGYEYLSLKKANWDKDTNIFTDIFYESICKINPDLELDDVKRFYQDVALALDNEDLGKAFFEMLLAKSGTKLIDFENFDNNSFHVVTELPYENGDDNFRPDIITLINGMPLAFIEVKKPNNRDGIIAERNRINDRFQNKKFRKFVNITQLMIFSNNMEYDNIDPQPIQGAFYAAPSYYKPIFNYFREEATFDLDQLLCPEEEALEDKVLKDTNYHVIKGNPEFLTNKNPNSPTNRILTSLLSRDRLAFLLQYALNYVKETSGFQKHIMRYPQIFATKAIENKLNNGVRKGIIWHTQGSGKTALAYYSVKFLTDYFQKKKIIPKFYFIVDRLDLATQASSEFEIRDLKVKTVHSRQGFVKDIQTTTALHNLSGKAEITVVNIQKFTEESNVVKEQDYNINIQRIYFLDEAHRSYNPKGSFLANLVQSDKNAIVIGLTGTPLLTKDYNSKDLFGDYIHKYYYNMSIADGYTLRLIREEIETKYKMFLKQTLEEIQVLQADIPKKLIYAHEKFVQPMLKYIVDDFEKFRETWKDDSVGGMVICDSSEQAREMFRQFNEQYAPKIGTMTTETAIAIAAEDAPDYTAKKKNERKVKTAALILYDSGTKDEVKQWVQDFKDGKVDFIFVFNMLLTGFDAKRLKKIYFGRKIKRHNLLQALTRVNRTYKDYHVGYVVDFADISSEFDATNQLYFDELQAEHGDEMEHYSNLFKSKEEIEAEILDIKELLFRFDTVNKEIFSQQIREITDRSEMLKIVKVLDDTKSLYNIIRLLGHYELLERIDFKTLGTLQLEAVNRLQILNQKENIDNNIEAINLLNTALEEVVFLFTKVGENELILADKLKNTLQQTREEMERNFDRKDPEFISLYHALEKLFKTKKISEVSQEDMERNIGALREIHKAIKELNRQNRLLQAKYDNDEKYTRVHKRLLEQGKVTKREIQLFEALQGVKSDADDLVLHNTNLLDNESYFEREMVKFVIHQFYKKQNIKLDAATSKQVNQLIVNEYMNDFYGRTNW